MNYSGKIHVSDALVTFCRLLCAVSGFWGVTCRSACAADVERLPLGAGFQGHQVIFLSLLSLRLHWLLWWTWEWRQIFLIISCLTFLVLLQSSLKLGRWQILYDSRGYCSHVVFQHVLRAVHFVWLSLSATKLSVLQQVIVAVSLWATLDLERWETSVGFTVVA